MILPDKKKCDWYGALYCEPHTYQATERMVVQGPMQAGETYRSYRLYLVGERPGQGSGRHAKPTSFRRKHNIYLYDLPDDRRQPLERCYDKTDEWYIAFYMDKPDITEYAPFGKSFGVFLHQQMNCGPYKDWKIDTHATELYDRHQMTVEYL